MRTVAKRRGRPTRTVVNCTPSKHDLKLSEKFGLSKFQLALYVLVRKSSAHGAWCCMTRQSIAELIGCRRKQVYRNERKLLELGLIVRRANRNPKYNSHYELIV